MKSSIQLIAGDASYRKFYRITSNKSTRIIVTANKEKYKNLIAYLAVNKFLRSKKILTPKLYEYNYNKGIIVIEDFGNFSFHKVLSKKKNKLIIYKKIIKFLLKIQKIKPKSKITSITNKIHKVNKYSNQYLHQESDLFFNWYLPLFLSKKKTLIIKRKAKKYYLNFIKKLIFLTLVLFIEIFMYKI